jgi:hypothetical protein
LDLRKQPVDARQRADAHLAVDIILVDWLNQRPNLDNDNGYDDECSERASGKYKL